MQGHLWLIFSLPDQGCTLVFLNDLVHFLQDSFIKVLLVWQVCRNQLCLLDLRLLLGLYHLVHIKSARTTSKVQQDNSHIGDFQELVHEICLTSVSSLWLLHCHLGMAPLLYLAVLTHSASELDLVV